MDNKVNGATNFMVKNIRMHANLEQRDQRSVEN